MTAFAPSYLLTFLRVSDGWVYTNDVWNEPRADALEDWKLRGMTRRRRWTRRIYHLDSKYNV